MEALLESGALDISLPGLQQGAKPVTVREWRKTERELIMMLGKLVL